MDTGFIIHSDECSAFGESILSIPLTLYALTRGFATEWIVVRKTEGARRPYKCLFKLSRRVRFDFKHLQQYTWFKARTALCCFSSYRGQRMQVATPIFGESLA